MYNSIFTFNLCKKAQTFGFGSISMETVMNYVVFWKQTMFKKRKRLCKLVVYFKILNTHTEEKANLLMELEHIFTTVETVLMKRLDNCFFILYQTYCETI